MTWTVDQCDWSGPEGRSCSLHKGHTPLVAWPHHAPDRLFPLGELIGVIRYPNGKRIVKEETA